MVSMEFFIHKILPAALWSWDWLSLWQMDTRNISWGGLRRPVRRADTFSAFMCWLSWNQEASISWNPQGLARPVMGLHYLYYLQTCDRKATIPLQIWNWYIPLKHQEKFTPQCCDNAQCCDTAQCSDTAQCYDTAQWCHTAVLSHRTRH